MGSRSLFRLMDTSLTIVVEQTERVSEDFVDSWMPARNSNDKSRLMNRSVCAYLDQSLKGSRQKRRKGRLRHFTRGHFELTEFGIAETGDVSSNRHIVCGSVKTGRAFRFPNSFA